MTIGTASGNGVPLAAGPYACTLRMDAFAKFQDGSTQSYFETFAIRFTVKTASVQTNTEVVLYQPPVMNGSEWGRAYGEGIRVYPKDADDLPVDSVSDLTTYAFAIENVNGFTTSIGRRRLSLLRSQLRGQRARTW